MNSLLTIVLPVRIDCRERLDNLKAVLTWIDKMEYPIILLEADRSPKTNTLIEAFKHIRYHFVEDCQKVFYRTKYINDLLRMADTEYVAVWDADVILPYSQIEEAVKYLCSKTITMVIPYNGTFYMLSPQQSTRFREQHDLLSLQYEKLFSPMGRTACGGIYMVHRKRYLSLGGDNEKFIGWGPEDAERLHRVQIAGEKVAWIDSGPLYHLHHERNDWSDVSLQQNLLAMQKEFVKICGFTQAELWAYIQTELLPHSFSSQP